MTKASRIRVVYKNLGFKFLHGNGRPPYGKGSYARALPKNGKPGRWRRLVGGKILLCHRGYHIARPDGIEKFAPRGYYGTAYIAEISGETSSNTGWGEGTHRDKIAGRAIRLLIELPVTWDLKSQARQRFVKSGVLTKSGKAISRRWLRQNGFEPV